MGIDGWIAVAILVLAAVVFVRKWAPPEVVALGIPVLLAIAGIFPDPLTALQGFGNPAVIALGAIFVVGAGLQSSGIAALFARMILRVSGQNEWKILTLLMSCTAAVSGFMSNAASTALFLPTAVTVSRRALIAPSRLLLPMASAAVLGGTLTVVGTPPNLLISQFLEGRTGTPFSIFRFTMIGIPLVVAGILYTLTIGRKLLPKRSHEERMRDADLPEDLAVNYGFTRNLSRMRIPPESTVAGQTIAESGIRSRHGLLVVLVHRRKGLVSRYLDPKPDLVLQPGDFLYIEGDDESAWRFAEEEGLQFGLAGPGAIERILGRGHTLAEVSIAPRSPAVGKTLAELRFRDHHGLNVVSFWRQGKSIPDSANTTLEVGDTLLVSGPTTHVVRLQSDSDYIVLTDQSEAIDVGRAPRALSILLVAVLPPILGIAPLAISALAAAILMIGSGCLSIEEARRSIEWKVVLLIAGTLPLGLALETTGVAALAAHALLGATLPLGAPAVIGSLFFLAAVISVTSSNSAAAVIIAPIAAEVATRGALGLETALLAVAYGCSCAFILPMAQWNLMVMAPGGYQARDFFRFGIGLSLVMGATVVGLLSIRPG
ncbi:MAG: SLC13 family permease [Gemmatimonadota bacterium]|nr:MAG: SLC13 family permease [Gemmatimonadota bacterium]